VWRGFAVGLVGIFFTAAGQGTFLILTVAYMEQRGVPVATNGLMQGFLSLVEAGVCLLAGFRYAGNHTRRIIAAGILSQIASALVFATQPMGVAAWLAIAANAVGMGIIDVILYVAALERRPVTLALGTAVGLYTGALAAGNAFGQFFSGRITDRWGYGASFSFAALMFLMVLVSAVLLGKKPAAPVEGSQPSAGSAHAEKTPPWAWKLGIAAGFSMAMVNSVFDTLFPIYGLRVGLTFSLIGTLTSVKMLMAAIVRPFSGAIMSRLNGIRLNSWSMAGLAAATVLTPLVGVGAGLTALVSAMGLGFGTVRVTSAATALTGQNDARLTSRRSGMYNTALSFGQIVGPWISGLAATAVGLSSALVGLPGIFLLVYGAALLAIPRLKSSADAVGVERTA
jgi:MFS family permease